MQAEAEREETFVSKIALIEARISNLDEIQAKDDEISEERRVPANLDEIWKIEICISLNFISFHFVSNISFTVQDNLFPRIMFQIDQN
jgi:hypothetical protein